MLVAFTEQFKKEYRKRTTIGAISEQDFKNILQLFINNTYETKLKTHKLLGVNGCVKFLYC